MISTMLESGQRLKILPVLVAALSILNSSGATQKLAVLVAHAALVTALLLMDFLCISIMSSLP